MFTIGQSDAYSLRLRLTIYYILTVTRLRAVEKVQSHIKQITFLDVQNFVYETDS